MVDLVIVLGLSLIISLLMTPLLIRIAEKYKIYDSPNSRSIHKERTPLLGGVSFYLAIFISTLFLSNSDKVILKFLFILGLTSIVAMGIVDDIKHLSVRFRLLVLVILAFLSAFVVMNYYLYWNVLNGYIYIQIISFIFIIFWIVGVANSINFIDGMDGLASYISIISLISFSIILALQNKTEFPLIISLSTLGAVLGFIPYNRHKALIFMGDAGSMLLGFILSFLSIILVAKSEIVFSIIVPIFILFLPIMDMTTSILRRIIFNKSIFKPDKMHFHHLLERKIVNHIVVIILLTLIQIVFSTIGILVFNYKAYIFGSILLVSIFIVSMFVFAWIYKKIRYQLSKDKQKNIKAKVFYSNNYLLHEREEKVE